MSNQKGQALVESLYACAFLILICGLLFRLSSYVSIRALIRHFGIEALHCQLETGDPVFCQNEAQVKLSHAIGWTRPYIRLQRTGFRDQAARLEYHPSRPNGPVEAVTLIRSQGSRRAL